MQLDPILQHIPHPTPTPTSITLLVNYPVRTGHNQKNSDHPARHSPEPHAHTMAEMNDKIVVAVRTRPQNSRERSMGAVNVRLNFGF